MKASRIAEICLQDVETLSPHLREALLAIAAGRRRHRAIWSLQQCRALMAIRRFIPWNTHFEVDGYGRRSLVAYKSGGAACLDHGCYIVSTRIEHVDFYTAPLWFLYEGHVLFGDFLGGRYGDHKKGVT